MAVAEGGIVVDADDGEVPGNGEVEAAAGVEDGGGELVVGGEDTAGLGERGEPGVEPLEEVVLVAERPGILQHVAGAARGGEDVREARPAAAAPEDARTPADEREVGTVPLGELAVRGFGEGGIVVHHRKRRRIGPQGLARVEVDDGEAGQRGRLGKEVRGTFDDAADGPPVVQDLRERLLQALELDFLHMPALHLGDFADAVQFGEARTRMQVGDEENRVHAGSIAEVRQTRSSKMNGK